MQASDPSAPSHGAATPCASHQESSSSSSKARVSMMMIGRTMSQQAGDVKKSFKTPPFIIHVAGASLTFCAGMVNATAKTCFGLFVSHVSGAVTTLGMETHAHDFHIEHEKVMNMIEVVASFIFGSFLCGMLITSNEIRFGTVLYSLPLIGNSFLLILATCLGANDKQDYALYCCAAACGLQNGLCTTHFGATVRTTHLTGLATDLGIAVGRTCTLLLKRGCRVAEMNLVERAKMQVDMKKIRIFLVLGFSFLFGAITGAFLSSPTALGFYALLIPATGTGTAGLLYGFYREPLERHQLEEKRRLEQEVKLMHAACSFAAREAETNEPEVVAAMATIAATARSNARKSPAEVLMAERQKQDTHDRQNERGIRNDGAEPLV